MPEKDPTSPATTSLAYDIMAPRWAKIDALLGGTETMRAAGRAYLPQHCAETDRAYTERLTRCTLLNMVDMTLTSLVSRPFSAPLKLNEDIPEPVRTCLDDVDQQGTSLERFAREWFKDGVAKAYSAVLVEFPRPQEQPGRPRTMADDLRENLRPYLVDIAPENILSGSYRVENGQEVLTQLRIREEVVEQQGFAEVVKERIRVLEPGTGVVYEKRKEKNSKKETWVVIERYTYDLDFIPVVFFYSNREGFMRGRPPLTDLADLNIRHWQSTADQIAVLTVARFPMLAVSGTVDAETLTVGPNQLLSVNDPQGKFYYVEHSGKAIAAGREDTLDLEERMAEYGATFLKKRPGGATATARALDSVEITSALQDMAKGFNDALNMVLWMMAQWLKLPEGGTCAVKTDFGLSDKAEAALNTLTLARKMKDISRTEYLRALMRYEVLQESFPIEDNEKELEDERKSAMDEAVSQAKQLAVIAPAKPPGGSSGA